MQVFPFVVVAWILGVGLYGVVTSGPLVHQIVCLIVVQSSTYVLLLGVGYVTGGVAPYFFDVPNHTPAVDPVVQACALTDVVVEAAVTAMLLCSRSRPTSGSARWIRRNSPPLRDSPRRGPAIALVVVVPLFVAAGVTASGLLFRSRRRILNVVAILTAAAVAVMLFVIMIRTAHGDQVYWFAGFRRARGVHWHRLRGPAA